MSVTTFSGISHLDFSVSDAEASAAWYVRVLGLRRLRRVDLAERVMIVLLHEPAGLVIGLNEHSATIGGAFDEHRVGLDHVGFAVTTRNELDVWQARLAELGVEHSPAADTESGAALVFRDPDNIQLEFWWTKPRGGAATS